MKRKWTLWLLISILATTGCSRSYELGDYYQADGDRGVVLVADGDGRATLIMSLDEVSGIDADSAARWAETLGDGGWRLPTKWEVSRMKKYRTLINSTLERKRQQPMMMGHLFYWTGVPCSESHTYACGPDGVRCYFNSNATHSYRARAVKEMGVKGE